MKVLPMTDIDSVRLEQFRVGIRRAIPWATLRESFTLYEEQDAVLQSMILAVQAYVLAEEIDNRSKRVKFSVSLPKDWWQHFKYDKFPHWLLRKFPVKYEEYWQVKTVKFRRLATYPKANIIIPDKVGDTVVYRNVWEEQDGR